MKTWKEKFDGTILYPHGKENGRYNGMSIEEENKIKSFIQSEVEGILEEIQEACIYGGVAYDYVDIGTIEEIFKKHGFDLTKK